MKHLFLFFLLTAARDEPLQVYDEGVKKGQALNVNCSGSGVTCTRSFDGGVNGTLWTLTVDGLTAPYCGTPGVLTSDAGQLVCTTTLAGGNDTEYQYNNQGVLAGSPPLVYDGTTPVFRNFAQDAGAPDGGMRVFARRIADHMTLRSQMWGEREHELQRGVARGQSVAFLPGSSASVTGWGTEVSTSGVTTINASYGNLLTQTRRWQLSAANANVSAARRSGEGTFFVHDTAGLGGFYCHARCTGTQSGFQTTKAVGLFKTVGKLGGTPSQQNPTLAEYEFVAFLHDCGGQTWKFCTKGYIDAGISAGPVLANCTDTGFNSYDTADLYEMEFYLPPVPASGSRQLCWQIMKMSDGTTANGCQAAPSGPMVYTPLALQAWVGEGNDAGTSKMDCADVYCESDL